MSDAKSSSTSSSLRAAANMKRVKQYTQSLRDKTSPAPDMSKLRVVNPNTSLGEEAQSHPHTPLTRSRNDLLSTSPIPVVPREATHAPPASPSNATMSAVPSPAPPSVFDIAEEDESDTQPTTAVDSASDGQDFATHKKSSSDDQDSFNLKAPPPAHVQTNIEALSSRFFSVDHLDSILRDSSLALKFTRFLQQYRPQHVQTLKQYAEARKAFAAVEFANAIARQTPRLQGESPRAAAKLDEGFEAWTKHVVADLVENALPAYLTHRLVALVTETLVKEITGNSAPVMHDLLPSLAEVYCITDPSLPDNPIVYASDEFYTTTQYGKDYVIGKNCRFLQGPQTSRASVQRLVNALTRGEECCETILNYRRDGSPFLNLLMMAPMYDNKGIVRYFLGAQIDISNLIDGGRGLESFAQLLSQDRANSRYGGQPARDPKQILSDLGQLLTPDETEILQNRVGRMDSMVSQSQASVTSSPNVNVNRGSKRVLLGMDEPANEPSLWSSLSLGHSGRLPGVYQNYVLVRPYPSLRITFTSPALRIPGLLQTRLLDRIGGPVRVREGLADALERGTGVTAKVTWLSSSSGTSSELDSGRPRWIHCTPMLGSDEKIGVWMVVMVEEEQVTGALNAQRNGTSSSNKLPLRPAVEGFSSSKLYADYIKREGRTSTRGSDKTHSRSREGTIAEEQFHDF